MKKIMNLCGNKVEFEVFEENIKNTHNYSWESLLTPNNDVIFATVKDDKGLTIRLLTAGEVRLINEDKDITLSNNQLEDNDKLILSYINNDKDFLDNWVIWSNNWNSIEFYETQKGKSFLVDDQVFESEPTNVQELLNELVIWYEWFSEM